MSTQTIDYLIIGAGILGASLGAELVQRKPGARVLIVEKESAAARHQTGRNSGVVHSGVYYTPKSLKARFCRAGLDETRAFCESHNIDYEPRGKLIVATDAIETRRLEDLDIRARENGVAAHWLDAASLRKSAPNVQGVAALHIPATAITDFAAITRTLLAKVEDAGGEVLFGANPTEVRSAGVSYLVRVNGRNVQAKKVIACAGLMSDRVARMLGIDPGVRIIPFKGEYFVLPASRKGLVHAMIYPVPNPKLPFLGVHLTPMIDGTITVGPNAVLSLAREEYGRFSFDGLDAADTLFYAGLWRMLAKHPRATLSELKSSLSKRRYLKLMQKYCPQLRLKDLSSYRAANRAQAVWPDGTLVDDFLIKTSGGLTAVLNAPSPAATSAMPIARHIADSL